MQACGKNTTFPKYDIHCNKIHSPLTAVHCFDNGNVGKQPVAWKGYCGKYWLKEFQENMDRFTGYHDITDPTNKVRNKERNE